MIELHDCCGCSACASACPKDAIRMDADKYGFYVPQIDGSKCIQCNICNRVCPKENDGWQRNEKEIGIYLCQNKNETTRLNSSSGGVFYELANCILEKGGVVFGCAWTSVGCAEHICVTEKQELPLLQKSKYVQSKAGSSYQAVKTYLDRDRWVLFSGTPCQVAGLRNYIGIAANKLVCVDFVCHGVPSPKTLSTYLKAEETVYHKQIKGIDFRSKHFGWETLSLETTFADGEKHFAKASEDAYYRSFLANLGLNDSCTDCRYNVLPRSSDLTLGDFWMADQTVAGFRSDGKGTSFVVVNSACGRSVFEEISKTVMKRNVSREQVMKGNPFLNGHCTMHPRSKIFLEEINRESFCAESFSGTVDRLLAPTFAEAFAEVFCYKMKRIKTKLRNVWEQVRFKFEQFRNRQQLECKSFSILCNNCWGGFVYQYFGLRYNTPTIGLYFLGKDFVKFAADLDHYLAQELVFIPWEDSSYYDHLKGNAPYPVAKLEDIEIYFMHYRSPEEAAEKWNKRKQRINRDRILFKLSEREGCTREDVERFVALPLKNKICFSYDRVDGAIHVPELKDFVGDETPVVEQYYNTIQLINSIR